MSAEGQAGTCGGIGIETQASRGGVITFRQMFPVRPPVSAVAGVAAIEARGEVGMLGASAAASAAVVPGRLAAVAIAAIARAGAGSSLRPARIRIQNSRIKAEGVENISDEEMAALFIALRRAA